MIIAGGSNGPDYIGSVEPTDKYPGMIWAYVSKTSNIVRLRYYDGITWIDIGEGNSDVYPVGFGPDLSIDTSALYGYVCGGSDYGVASLSTVEFFQFPFNSGIGIYAGTLSGSRFGTAACNYRNNAFYVCGGNAGVTTIDRFYFPFKSGSGVVAGNLSGSVSTSAGNNSSNYGFVCGGIASANLSTIFRLSLPFGGGTAGVVGNLSQVMNEPAGNNSSTYGYVCGGWAGGTNYSVIFRFQFPFDSGTANVVGSLTGSRHFPSANNSSTYGYVCGGSPYPVSNYPFSMIDRFQFPFNSGTATTVGYLYVARSGQGSNNSSVYGYSCGALFYNGSAFVSGSTIDRFQFPFNSGTANYVGNLSGTKFAVSAIDPVDFYQIFV